MVKTANIKTTAAVLLIVMLLILPWGTAPLAFDRGEEVLLDPEISAAFAGKEFIPIIAFFTTTSPPDPTPQPRREGERATAALVNALQEQTRAGLAGVETVLAEQMMQGNIKDYRSLWIVNAFAARVNREGLQTLAGLAQIEKIRLDRALPLSFSRNPVSVAAEMGKTPASEKSNIGAGAGAYSWNLELINAPSAWQEGITGKDIVVAIMDTGVDPSHPALQGKYRGNLPGHSNATSWFDVTASPEKEWGGPRDSYGHGTHMAGIILGGSPLEPLGVAPGARWIGVNIFDDGFTWDSHITQAFQWLLAPGGDPANAPHIINCSWASRPEYVSDYLQWEILHRLEQAGIFVVFAAGNNGFEGPGSPASYPHAFCAGALKKEGETIKAADFSSRGPVSWQGMNFIKPEITAPGTNIRSAWLNGGYTVLDGTSTAAAHVSGSAALLLEARPGISPAEIGHRLKQTARWFPSWSALGERPNGTYGYGLLDIAAAIRFNNPPPAELLFYDGAEEGIMNWKTTPQNPWKITREKVYDGAFAFADSPWDRYPNNASSWLELSEPISLCGYHDPVLSFRHFYDLRRGQNREDDYASVEISADGRNWVRLYRFSGSSGEYRLNTFPLRLPEGKQNLFLRFRLQSNGNGPGVGWYIDEIMITARPRPLTDLEELQISTERRKIGTGENIEMRADALFCKTLARPLDPALLEWSSANPAVAIVDKGKVTAIAPGETEIRAQFAGRTAGYRIEVIEVPPPQATPASGTYINEVTVELAGEIAGSRIYFTLDGSEPDETSNLYAEPLHITKNKRIKARAYFEGIPGKTAEFLYTIQEGATVDGSLQLQHRPPGANNIEAYIVCQERGKHYNVIFTGKEGRFIVKLPLGSYKLVAKRPQYLAGVTAFRVTERGSLTLPLLILPVGDVNNNNRIDLVDLSLLALAYGTVPGDGNWDPRADLNGDGRVDITDLTLLTQNYSSSVSIP
ncbi:MAG: S8 family serine peptidase [Bacillota bacterium]